MIWNNSRMTHLYYDEDEAVENEPCRVQIDGDSILVQYDDEDRKGRPVVAQYKGKSQGDGHYLLTNAAANGKATLHRFGDGTLLEGSWVEDSVRGMWRIVLKT